MKVSISKFYTCSMHYTYWKSVKNFDNFKRIVQHNCPSDLPTLTFAFSRLSQFYKVNAHNTNYYTIFKSLESNILKIPVDRWNTRELSSVALSLSFFKKWLKQETITHIFKSINRSIGNLSALDISHIMAFLSNLNTSYIDNNADLNNILKNISEHIRGGRILDKNTATAKNIIYIISAYAKLDITDSQLLYTCCNELSCRLDEITHAHEVTNALNAIIRMLNKCSNCDKVVEMVICELITKFQRFDNIDSESFADFLDSISRLIVHNRVSYSDQLLQIFTLNINKYSKLLIEDDKPKILRVILRSLRNINFRHQIFVDYCIKKYVNNYNLWSFGAFCDLISTIGQLNMQNNFITSGLDKETFNKLVINMNKYKYIPQPDTFVNLVLICQFDKFIMENAEAMIVYLLDICVHCNITDSCVDKLSIAAMILFQIRPGVITLLRLNTIKMLYGMIQLSGIVGYQGDNLELTISYIDKCLK